MSGHHNVFLDAFYLPYGRHASSYYSSRTYGNINFVQRLALERKFTVHTGCVNTIQWSDNGQYLLSGSDDQKLVVTDPYSGQVKVSVQSGHRANIFSAKFLPNSQDKQVVSCSGDGLIYYTRLERPDSYLDHGFDCHFGTTYEVLTVPQDAHSFLSCGEDGTVRWFDLRIKDKCTKEDCKEDVLINCRRAVTSIAVNPITPYQLGVGCSDSTMRIYDRRMLGTKATGNHSSRSVTGMMSRFSAPGLENKYHRITSLSFSPDAEEVLVSYSSQNIYLFNLKENSNEAKQLETSDAGQEGDGTKPKTLSRQPPIKRLRLRGDWSDTGPSARPERERGERVSDQAASLMQRMSDLLTRWLEGNTRQGEQQDESNPSGAEGGSETEPLPQDADLRPEPSTSTLEPGQGHPEDQVHPEGQGHPEGQSKVRCHPNEGEVHHDSAAVSGDSTEHITSSQASEATHDNPAVITKSKVSILGSEVHPADKDLLDKRVCCEETSVGDSVNDISVSCSVAPPLVPVQQSEHSTEAVTTKPEGQSVSHEHQCLCTEISTTESATQSQVKESSHQEKSTTPHMQEVPSTRSLDTLLGTHRSSDQPRCISSLEYPAPTLPAGYMVRGSVIEPVVSLQYRPEGTCASTIRVDCRVRHPIELGPGGTMSEEYTTAAPRVSGSTVPDTTAVLSTTSLETATATSDTISQQSEVRGSVKNEGLSIPGGTVSGKRLHSASTSESESVELNTKPSSESEMDVSLESDRDLLLDQVRVDSVSHLDQICSGVSAALSVSSATTAADSCLNDKTEEHKKNITASLQQQEDDKEDSTPAAISAVCDVNLEPNVSDGSTSAPNQNTSAPGDITSSSNNATSAAASDITTSAPNDSTCDITPGPSGIATAPVDSSLDRTDVLPGPSSTRQRRVGVSGPPTGSATSADPTSSSDEDSEGDNEGDSDTERMREARRSRRGRWGPRASPGWSQDHLPDRHLAALRLQTLYRQRQQAREQEEMMKLPQPTMKAVYKGHRNARTMIKEATFWGSNYVVSGSDCGHVFIWDRKTTKLVMLLEGDKHVVNCVQPHPYDPVLATSGIDYDIKLWSPSAAEPCFDTKRAAEILSRNEVMLEETRDTITVPASFMMRMLASLNHFRSARSGPPEDNTSSDDDDG